MSRVWMLMLLVLAVSSVKPLTRRTSNQEQFVDSNGDVASLAEGNLTAKAMANADRVQLLKRLSKLDNLIADSGEEEAGEDDGENKVVDSSNATREKGEDADETGKDEVGEDEDGNKVDDSSNGTHEISDALQSTGCKDALPAGYSCSWKCPNYAKGGKCDRILATGWWSKNCWKPKNGGAAPSGKVKDFCKESCGKCPCMDSLPDGYTCSYKCPNYATEGKCQQKMATNWRKKNCFSGTVPSDDKKVEDFCKESCGKCPCMDSLPDGYKCSYKCPNYATEGKCQQKMASNWRKKNCFSGTVPSDDKKVEDFCKESCGKCSK